MKKWNAPEFMELSINQTANGKIKGFAETERHTDDGLFELEVADGIDWNLDGVIGDPNSNS